MSADHLLAADVVLSDGSLATFDNSIFDSRSSNTRLSNIVSAVQEIKENYAEAIKQNYPNPGVTRRVIVSIIFCHFQQPNPRVGTANTHLFSLRPSLFILHC